MFTLSTREPLPSAFAYASQLSAGSLPNRGALYAEAQDAMSAEAAEARSSIFDCR